MSPRTLWPVSTRRLIVTALVCGLAILVAGGIQLFRLKGADRVELPGLGQARDVNGVRVTAVALRDVSTTTVVEVELAALDSSTTGSAGDGWTLLRRTTFAPVGVPSGAGTPCATVTLSVTPQRCVVAFDAGASGDRYLAYHRGPIEARWALGR